MPNPAHARLGREVIDGAIHGVTAAARLARAPRRRWLGVDVTANVAYRDTGMEEHLLDVYRSRLTPALAPRPGLRPRRSVSALLEGNPLVDR